MPICKQLHCCRPWCSFGLSTFYVICLLVRNKRKFLFNLQDLLRMKSYRLGTNNTKYYKGVRYDVQDKECIERLVTNK